MREIKFRGKRIDNGQWAYGYYAVHKMMLTGEMDYFIIVDEQRPQSIDPKTVGQYTSLKDKNGIEIFEGDIIRRWLRGYGETQMRRIKWIEVTSTFSGIDSEGHICPFDAGGTMEVIGNIYENPELLEVTP